MDVILTTDDMSQAPEAEICKWLVSDGSVVEKGQLLVELETGKATFEFAAPCAGTLKIFLQVGALVEPGTKIANIS